MSGGDAPSHRDALRPLDPRGRIHIPIGIADTLDALKTFVEAEGNFSPGFGTYGIYFWVFDEAGGGLTGKAGGRLVAPTLDGVACERGLAPGGLPIPWTRWKVGDIEVTTEVCEVRRPSPAGEVFAVGARVRLKSSSTQPRRVSLYAALRPLGPAGWAVERLEVGASGKSLLVDDRVALASEETPSSAGALPADTIGDLALRGEMPVDRAAASEEGDCSGALRLDAAIEPLGSRSFGFVCPVLPGRRAQRHRWDGVSTWAQFDLAAPNPKEGGILQPDPGEGYWEGLRAQTLFDEATRYWKDLAGRVVIDLPDPRWAEAFAAILAHSALSMNEGAPDVAVANYNVFNRDGVYMASILEKAGQLDLAARAIDYFLAHPFNGRVEPEADNPGQVLWILGEHWKFAQDAAWLERVYPSVRKLAAMVRYYRTSPGPHWVGDTSLDFGDALEPGRRKELKPGSCDGFHPEYTEAFDVAGIRAAALLAVAKGEAADAAAWDALAGDLFSRYDARFGARLGEGYGSYCVLWPCRLYSLDKGKAHDRFRGVGGQRPASWRYFPLATAHQGLLAGSREAGWKTLEIHLQEEQMRGWYAFDEGGASGVGGWNHVRTTWKRGKESVAMPHGWAIAELQLLLRDSIAFEDGDRLVLLGGVPPGWLWDPRGLRVEGLPTHFGKLSFDWTVRDRFAALKLGGDARPPGGFVLRVGDVPHDTLADAEGVTISPSGDLLLPAGKRSVSIARLGDK